ncbi:M-phase phosphoprotein 6 [Anthophora retusa]
MSSSKAKLSKSILEMKFMKRTKEKVEKQQFQEEGEEYFGNELTKRMKKESERFIIEPSYVFCEKLIEEEKMETDVSDKQMANHWKKYRKMVKPEHKYEKLLQKRNNNHEPLQKKPKFLKPQD